MKEVKVEIEEINKGFSNMIMTEAVDESIINRAVYLINQLNDCRKVALMYEEKLIELMGSDDYIIFTTQCCRKLLERVEL